MKRFTVVDKVRGVFDQRYAKRVTKGAMYREMIAGKKGIEIGGPSMIFTSKGNLPLYDVIGSLDGCNYAALTVWNRRSVHLEFDF